MSTGKTYLPHLDALRFWAFLAVFIAHSMHLSQPELHNINTWQATKDALQVGVLGVNFFFVLSGFLITRLLLIEKDHYGHIDVLRFYARRCLRIWPVYFLVLLLVYVWYQWAQIKTNTHWLYYLSFTGNYHNIIHGAPQSPALANLWTIAVEEQFYLVWPVLLFIIPKRHIPALSALIIIASIWFRSIFHTDSAQLYFNTLSICSDFGVGALGAWLSISHLSLIQLITKNKCVNTTIYVFLAVSLMFYNFIFSNTFFILFERIFFSIIFVYIILEQVFSDNSIIKVGTSPYINYLGKISFGLYMYHAFGLLISYRIFKAFNSIQEPVIYMLGYPVSALLITILFAAFSYAFAEKPLLQLKKRFEK
jgi:peptidoglycan/LPS O-acetylase OafA/YrhL